MDVSPSPLSSGETVTTDTEVSLSSPSSASASAISQGSSHEIWGCPRCSLENSAANQTCTSCGADQYCQPIADTVPENDLLNDRSVGGFRVESTQNLQCRIQNGSVIIQRLNFMQDNPDCAAISLLNAIVHTHSANGSVSNEMFHAITTTLGGDVANVVRGGQNDGSYLNLRQVQQVLQTLLNDVTTTETSETDIFDSERRQTFLRQLESDERVAQGKCLNLCFIKLLYSF